MKSGPAGQDAFRLLRVQALEAACRTMAASGNYALATQAGAAAIAAEPLRNPLPKHCITAHWHREIDTRRPNASGR